MKRHEMPPSGRHMSRTYLDGRPRCSVPSLPVITTERIKAAKSLVEKAVKLRKVFSILGPYPVIRAGLLARGWVERRLRRPHQRVLRCSDGDDDDDGDDRDDNACISEGLQDREKKDAISDMYDLMSRLVRNETIYFYWTTRRDSIDCQSLQKDQMINHYANSCCFTTKVGLCLNLRNLHWFDAVNPDTFFPRCYKLGAQDDKEAFIEDFRRTACTNLLKYVVESSTVDSGDKLKEKDFALKGQKRSRKLLRSRCVGPGVIDTALWVCEEFLSSLEHSDIDVPIGHSSLSKQHWTEFLQDYYVVVHEGVLIQGASDFVKRCQDMLTRLQKVCPQLDTDGTHNIWIIKPGAMSRGRGIMCMNRLDEILTLVANDTNFVKESKWVVQKYLEYPLLVHGTKFDIRQWFLVTDWNPLTIWFYRECYLRFSTQPYSTKNLDSSVHLCNNSIQKHYQPSRKRHPDVPGDNMWSCSHFQTYLHGQGRGAEWATVVVPGMRQAVVHTMQTAQDRVEGRKASFELYGADFVLGRDLRPWLLEINTSPTMSCSTEVTARLCPAVQLDTLRVVLDHRLNNGAHTGGFELIYRQAPFGVPQYVGMNLLVEGAEIRRSKKASHRKTVVSKHDVTIQPPSGQTPSGQTHSGQTSTGQTSRGHTHSGQTPSRQTSTGQTHSGQTHSGQTSTGQTSTGQSSRGHTHSGQTSTGQTHSGQTPSRQTSTGQTPTGQTSRGHTHSGQTPSGQTSTGQTSTGQTPSGQTSTGQTSTGQTPSRQTSTGQTSTGQTPSGQTSTGQTSTGQTPSGQTSTGQTSTGQTHSGQTPSGQPHTTGKSSRRRRPRTKLSRRRTAKKSQSEAEKKRQQQHSPTSELERAEESCTNVFSCRKVVPGAERPSVLQPEPQKKARRLEALSLFKAALLPMGLSTSFSRPCNVLPAYRPQYNRIRGPQHSRVYVNQSAAHMQYRALPSLVRPLSVLEVFRLQPNPVSALSTRAVTFSCHPSLYGHSKYRADATVAPKADYFGC